VVSGQLAGCMLTIGLPISSSVLLTFRLPMFRLGLAWLPWKPLRYSASAIAVPTKLCLTEGQ